MNPAQLGELRRLLGASRVDTGEAARAAAAGDKWFATRLPDAVVNAGAPEHVCKLMRWAVRHGIVVTPRGAGYGYVGGAVPARGGVAVSLAGMRRIVEIDAHDFVAIVEPGVITADLAAAALRKGLYYPPDPASLANSSIGGNIATNAGGPRCLKYGVTRNYVLGLEVVLPDGTLVRTGGRTHKNKTGFDMTGLFVGSEGMLGIITQATLKLLPRPATRGVLAAVFPDMRKAAGAVARIFDAGHLPSALEVADAFTLRAARARLGTDILPVGDAHVLLEVDGRAAAVRAELRELRQLLSEAGAVRVDGGAGEQRAERLWGVRREFSASLKATGLTKLNEDIVVPRGRLVDLMTFAAGLEKAHGFPVACFGHAGDGNIHVNIMADRYDRRAVRRRVQCALDELFERVLAWGGAITGEHGVGLAKARWWPKAASPELRLLHRQIKAALDPDGLLNPGKFVSR